MENELPLTQETCRFCGQTKLLKTVGDITQSQADEMATEGCDCVDAKIWQHRQSKIKKAREWAKYRFEKTPNILSIFFEAFELITNNDIEKVSIREEEWTHNIFLDSDGFLTVKSSKKVEEEVDFS